MKLELDGSEVNKLIVACCALQGSKGINESSREMWRRLRERLISIRNEWDAKHKEVSR